MKRLLLLMLLASVAPGLGACATIVDGDDQTVTIDTEPSGAVCSLQRGGQTVAVVNPTPGSVTIGKSKDDISVLCVREGYQDSSGILASEFQGMTLGNALFGGLIGVAIDASSGAMNKYPEYVSVVLIPERFSSPEERDRFFDGLVAETEREHEEARQTTETQCRTNNTSTPSACAGPLRQLELAHQERLADIRRKRLAALVEPRPTSADDT